MKNNKRKRRANQPNQLPWFENFRTQLLNRAFANHFAGRGRYHAKMNPYWVAGTTAGLALCVFDQQREDYSICNQRVIYGRSPSVFHRSLQPTSHVYRATDILRLAKHF